MPRPTDEERLAALEKRKADIKAAQAKINRAIRGVQSHQKNKARSDRTHAGVVVGFGMIEHAKRNPSSEVRHVAIRIVEHWLETRPDDQPLVDLLAELKAAAPVPEAAE